MTYHKLKTPDGLRFVELNAAEKKATVLTKPVNGEPYTQSFNGPEYPVLEKSVLEWPGVIEISCIEFETELGC